MPNLRIFKLSWAISWYNHGHSWNIGELIVVIGKTVGATLEELSLMDSSESIYLGRPIVPMTEFKRLRALELTSDAIFRSDGSRYIDEDYASTDEETLNAEFSITDHDFGEFEVPRLVDLLPPSIENVTLSTLASRVGTYDMKRLMEGFRNERKATLPLLEKLSFVIEGYPGISASIDEGPVGSQVAGADDRSVKAYRIMREHGTCELYGADGIMPHEKT